MFRGILMGSSLHLSHLFYADDAVFMGHLSDLNIDTIVQVLECFYRASSLRINKNKSTLMGISVANVIVDQVAAKISCATLEAHFSYLGSKVGGLMSRVQSWNEIVNNLVARLSNWKMKTLSIYRWQINASKVGLSESSLRSSSESEEKTRHNLRRISASEERARIRMMELVSVDNSLLTP
ncbi:hypothetical protein Tco_0956520 [Tanacetum coccineum]